MDNKKFVDSLNNFTNALEELVEILYEQYEKNPSDILAKFAENLNEEKIKEISDNLTVIRENVVNVNKKTDEILKLIKEDRSRKETGMFGEIQDDKNKSKIVDGVKVIILIAAGVLAIGMALKIIGDVNPLSVIALGIAIYAIASAFAKIMEIKVDKKPISIKDAFFMSIILIMMSAAVLASGTLLKLMPTFTIVEVLGVLFVSISLSVMIYVFAKAFDKVKNIKNVMLSIAFIAPLMPLLALGIVASGYILQDMPEISFKVAISAIIVAIAMAPALITLAVVSKVTKELSIKNAITIGAIMPILAAGIVASSIILNQVQPVTNLKNILLTSLAIAISTISLLPLIIVMTKLKLTDSIKPKDFLVIIGLTVSISVSIALSSKILALGTYDKYPSASWSLSVGLAFILFTPAIIFIAKTISSNPKLILGMFIGAVITVVIAGAMFVTSLILSEGSYDTYPPLEWSASVGLSILTFGISSILLGAVIVASFGIGALAIASGLVTIVAIAETMVLVDEKLSKGSFRTFPSPDWSAGVGGSIQAFSEVLIELTKLKLLASVIDFFFGGKTEVDLPSFIRDVSEAIYEADTIFSGRKGSFSGSYPSPEWAKGVGLSIKAFSDVLIELTKLELDSIFASFFGVKTNINLPQFIRNVSEAILEAGRIFSESDVKFGEKGTYPSEEWAKGVGGVLVAFSEAIKNLHEAGLDLDVDDINNEDDGAVAVMKALTSGFIDIGEIWDKNTKAKFDIEKIPSKEWSEKIKILFIAFGDIIKKLLDSNFFENDIKIIFSELLNASEQIALLASKFESFKNVSFDPDKLPSKEWNNGIILTFKTLSDISNMKIDDTLIYKIGLFKYSILNMILLQHKIAKSDNKLMNNLQKMSYLFAVSVYNFHKMLSKIDPSNTKESIDAFVYAIQKYILLIKFINTNASNLLSDKGIYNKIAESINIIVHSLPTENKIRPLLLLVKAIENLSSIKTTTLMSFGILSTAIENISKSLDHLDYDKMHELNNLSISLQKITQFDFNAINRKISNINTKKLMQDNNINENKHTTSNINKTENDMSKVLYSKHVISEQGDFKNMVLNYMKNINEILEDIKEEVIKISTPTEEGTELSSENVNKKGGINSYLSKY